MIPSLNSSINSVTSTDDNLNNVNENDEKVELSDILNYDILIISMIFSVFLLLISLLYLSFITLKHAVDDFQTGTFNQTWNATGLLEKISLLLEIIDVTTDFIYASDLIIRFNHPI